MNNVFLTFDYELFLGSTQGGIKDCMINPTNKILDILDKHNVKGTFFVDFACLYHFHQIHKKEELHLINKQIEEMVSLNHSIQFHLHPHWMNIYIDKGNNGRFFIHEYSVNEIRKMVKILLGFAKEFYSLSFETYRAGSLDVQSLLTIELMLKQLGLLFDSSALDYKNIPTKHLEQYPITSTYYSPFFYWKLVFERYFGGEDVRKFGKGSSRSLPFQKKLKKLILGDKCHLSFDSNKWTKLNIPLVQNNSEIVILSHPKAMNEMALRAMSSYIAQNKSCAQFKVM